MGLKRVKIGYNNKNNIMEAPENKASITTTIVEKYDLSKGEGFFTQEITGSYAYALHIEASSLAGTPKKVDVTICWSNRSDSTSDSFAESSKTVAISKNGVYILEDFYLSSKFIGFKIKPTSTTGKIDLILTLSRAL